MVADDAVGGGGGVGCSAEMMIRKRKNRIVR